MFEKTGKFYADWRDRTGKRKRKSFNTARAALRYEAEQKEAAHPKPRAQGRPSPKFSAPASRATKTNTPTTTTREKRSSRKPDHAARKPSARRT